MRNALFLCGFILLGHQPLSAQQAAPINFQLKAYLERGHAPGSEVDLFLRGEVDVLRGLVTAHGGRVKMVMGGLVSARLPVDRVRALSAEPAVKGIEFSLSRGVALNDSMRVHNRINEVHAGGSPLQAGFNGSGVIMGIIDSGLDLGHPDFKDAQGRTRVLSYWDQNYPFDAQLTPQPYGYGQVWDSTAINAGLCPAVDQTQYFGHGTTVTGTAAGNGLATGAFGGVAPAADLIIVSSDFGLPNWKASVADAVKYIFDEAEARGMPAVINASLGDYLGSHDGRDAAALFIDSLLQAEPGRVMVCAAGNSGQFPLYHVEHTVGTDTTFTWYKHKATPNAFGYGVVYFDLWADTADLADVRYAVGADRVSPAFTYRGRTPFHSITDHLGQMGTDTLWSLSGNRLAIVDYLAELRGGQYHLEVHMQQPDSSAYYFRFMATGNGRFDGWGNGAFGISDMVSTGLPTAAAFPDIVRYVAPDGNKRIVDSWACSDQVLTVANYFNEVSYVDVNGAVQTVSGTEGAITPASSRGPTRDGRLKPDIAATGDITLSAGPLSFINTLISTQPFKVAPGGMHMRNGGTSMASPVVAGTAALFLEKCPLAPHHLVNDAIRGTARDDAFTGALPNTSCGHGKLDAFSALLTSNPDVSLSVFGDTALCVGDSVLVSGPAFMTDYAWTSGDSVKVFYFDGTAPLSVVVTDMYGCRGWSDTLLFTVNPPPPAPLITQVGNTLESSPADSYQWYFEGAPIGGADASTYDVGFSGNYFVQIADANGCTASSDTLFVLFTGLASHNGDAFLCWPSPTSGELRIIQPSHLYGRLDAYRVLDISGKVVASGSLLQQQGTLNVSALADGHYLMEFREGDRRWQARFTVQH